MICGLILVGGKSIRMGFDKYKIGYRGVPQYQYLQSLFSEMGMQSYLSVSRDQKPDLLTENNLIVDAYESRGPIGGILSAMYQFPDVSWLVVACDLPLINKYHLQQIMEHRTPDCLAITYLVHPNFYETTCTLYERTCRSVLQHEFDNGIGSLQKALQQMSVKTLPPPESTDLLNVNDRESYRRCMEILKRR